MPDTTKITPAKQEILDRALSSPDDPHSASIIAKAKERGWIKGDDSPGMLESFGRGFLETGTPIGPSAKYIAPAIEAGGDKDFIQTEAAMQNRLAASETANPKMFAAGKIAGYMTPTGLAGVVAKLASKGMGVMVRPFLSRVAASAAGVLADEVANSVDKNKTLEEINQNVALGAASAVGGEALTAGLSKGAKGARSLIASLRGIPKESVETYAKSSKGVNKLITKELRDEFLPSFAMDTNEKIKTAVGTINGQLDEILKGATKPVPIASIAAKADDAFNAIDSQARTPQVKQQAKKVFEQIQLFEQMKSQGVNEIPAIQVQALKRDLQDMAYNILEENGFKENKASEAYKAIAGEAQRLLENVGGKEVKELNKKLSSLITSQEKLRIPNVFKADGGLDSDKARQILSTLPNESKTGMRAAAKALDEAAGTNLSMSADEFKAAINMEPKDLMSIVTTGRSILPLAVGGAAGGLVGGDTAQDRSIGAVMGALAASPMSTRPTVKGLSLVEMISKNPQVKGAVSRGLYGAIKENQ